MMMNMLTSKQIFLTQLFIFAVSSSIVSGSAIPEGECQHFHLGGVSGVHFYTCCNYPNSECSDVEFDGASDGNYCDDGQSTEEGGGTELGDSFACGDTCNKATECKDFCDAEAFSVPAFCWNWSLCFDACCDDPNGTEDGVDGFFISLPFNWCTEDSPDRRLDESSSICGSCTTSDVPEIFEQQCTDYCGDGICGPGECSSNCPEDCPSPAPTLAPVPTTGSPIDPTGPSGTSPPTVLSGTPPPVSPPVSPPGGGGGKLW